MVGVTGLVIAQVPALRIVAETGQAQEPAIEAVEAEAEATAWATEACRPEAAREVEVHSGGARAGAAAVRAPAVREAHPAWEVVVGGAAAAVAGGGERCHETGGKSHEH